MFHNARRAFYATNTKLSKKMILRGNIQCPFALDSRGLINYIDSQVKCRHPKNWTLRQVFIFWGPERHTLPPYTLYSIQCIRVYNILIHTGKEGVGRVFNQREGLRCNSSQSWVENSNMTECIQSINSDKHLPEYPFTGQFFRWRHFALVSPAITTITSQNTYCKIWPQVCITVVNVAFLSHLLM